MYRTSKHAIIGGLCAALGNKLGISRHFIRFFFIIGVIFTGVFPGILVYLLLCIFIPKKDDMIQEPQQIKVNNRNFCINAQTQENKIKDMVQKITKISSNILNNEKNNPIVQRIIEEFKDKITEFQKYSPQLEQQYLSCVKFLRENNIEQLKLHIVSLKEKIELSSNDAKNNYLDILEQAEKRMQLINEIKDHVEVIESKLYLILNTLQNIEASIFYTELQAQATDNKYDSLQSQISVLTESITEMSDIYKKNKLRL